MKTYSDMSNNDYHALKDYISSSFVKSVAKHSIAKALQPIEPNQALLFGDAMHTYFEDSQAFHKRFKVFKDSEIIAKILERRPDITSPTMTKDYKTYKKDFECSLGENQVSISEDDMYTIQYMYQSMVDNDAVKEIYKMYDPSESWDEYSFLTEEEDLHGLKYRVRPDRLLVRNEEPMAILDWKSCRDASEKSFRSDFWKYRYDLQAAFYCDVMGILVDDFYFVAIEKQYPFNTAVYGLNPETQMNALKELNVIKYRIGEWKNNPKQAEMGLPNTNTITLL
jgi:hypothetical protein